MQDNELFLLQNLYNNHLETINNISFTHREIDVMACLFNLRGTSKISTLLRVSPHTVVTHVRNIMSKLECSSREGIIDFIEKSYKASFFKSYYTGLLISTAFTKSLGEISKLKDEKVPICLIVLEKTSANKTLLQCLENHLRQVGLQIEIRYQDLDDSIKDIQPSPKILLLLTNNEQLKKLPKGLASLGYLELKEDTNYYFLFFDILKKFFPPHNIESIYEKFKNQYESIQDPITSKLIRENTEDKLREREKIDFKNILDIQENRRWYVLLIFLLVSISSFVFMLTNSKKEGEKQNNAYIQESQGTFPIRSDVNLPKEAVLLKRPQIIEQIKNGLQGNGEIKVVALVGVGGSGKTTLARQFAREAKTNVLWEINAETHENLISSFESLAQTLAKTKEDKDVLKNLQDIKVREQREEKTVQFARDKLNFHKNWILIYDNVDKFCDIQKYFPQDSSTWGVGKVILTTRNTNIENNKYINNTIQIGELSRSQKLDLFQKIIRQGSSQPSSLMQIEETKRFLENIPSFPLDVSIAAYYLKSTHISYNKYLENLAQHTKDFEYLQESFLKESGDYIKTRYSIITLSLQHIIQINKDFSDLLLFVSLLDSQNLPLELLYKYKGNLAADNFIFNLKKYSFIANEEGFFPSLNSFFSIHRDIQPMILNYLISTRGGKNLQKTTEKIASLLNDHISEAIEKEDLLKIRHLTSHCEKFLNHDVLPKGGVQESIRTNLGRMYTYLGDYVKAEQLLSQSLINLRNKNEEKDDLQQAKTLTYLGINFKKLENYEKAQDSLKQGLNLYQKNLYQNTTGVALASTYLGAVYKHLGDYKQATVYLEQGLSIYRQHIETHASGVTRALSYLGNIFQKLGNYEKARDLLGESLGVCQKYFPEDHIGKIHALARLGSIEVSLGHYEKGKNLLLQSLKMYKKLFSDSNQEVIWVSTNLGNVYRLLGDYEESKDLLEKSLYFQQKKFKGSSHTTAWIQLTLAKTYKASGNYAKAKELLNKSLKTYETRYGDNHSETANVLGELGHLYLLEGNTELAEDLLQKAYNILQKIQHPDQHIISETLSELRLKKANMEKAKKF